MGEPLTASEHYLSSNFDLGGKAAFRIPRWSHGVECSQAKLHRKLHHRSETLANSGFRRYPPANGAETVQFWCSFWNAESPRHTTPVPGFAGWIAARLVLPRGFANSNVKERGGLSGFVIRDESMDELSLMAPFYDLECSRFEARRHL